MSSCNSSPVSSSRSRRSETLSLSPFLADSISIPARVTRRAKRSGLIAASPRPLERARRGASRSGRSTIFAASKPLMTVLEQAEAALGFLAQLIGPSTWAFWRQRRTQEISSRGEA